VIEAANLVKSFDHRVVLDHLSLSVRRGEIYALLGENGSGKTTLLKILAGLYGALEGRVTIDGLDRQRDHLAIRRFTAWLADRPLLYSHFSARKWLEMIAGIYEVEPAIGERRINELLDAFNLRELERTPVAALSAGQYKKTAICGALVTGARLYLMDEPFTGEIDPPGVATFKEIFRELRRRNDVTVLFSTQLVDQAEQLATRVGILHEGRIAHEGTPAELKERFGATSMEEVFTRATGRDRAAANRVLETL
jgi:ABC-2 type transport system ATP-binding protein